MQEMVPEKQETNNVLIGALSKKKLDSDLSSRNLYEVYLYWNSELANLPSLSLDKTLYHVR